MLTDRRDAVSDDSEKFLCVCSNIMNPLFIGLQVCCHCQTWAFHE